jgi:CubicO group peptidase (beta-lactamase class C family)
MKIGSIAIGAMALSTLIACDQNKTSEPETAGAAFEEREGAPASLIQTRASIFEPENIVWTHQHMAELFPSRTISKGERTHRLNSYPRPLGATSFQIGDESLTVDEFLTRNHTQGIVVLHKGTIVFEKYFGEANESTRFTTWSVGKSITSTLVGIAIKDGLIESVNDPLTVYIPELIGTAYDGVSIAQVLQMSSGVKFNEDYANDGTSDVWDYFGATMLSNKAPANEMAATYPRASEPGTVFNYNTAETQILGWLLKNVTGKSPSTYLEKEIWQPLGMSHDATWLMDSWGEQGMEMTGCCLNAALRDWARFGQFFLEDGMHHGETLLPDGWVAQATTPSASHLEFSEENGSTESGYQYQWWAMGDGRYSAEGVYGQFIFIDPKNEVVIAKASTWPTAWRGAEAEEALLAFEAIIKALD